MAGLSVASIHMSLEKNVIFPKGHVCFLETPSYSVQGEDHLGAPDTMQDIPMLRFYICLPSWKEMQAFLKFCELSSDKSRFSFFGMKTLANSDMVQTLPDAHYERKLNFMKREAGLRLSDCRLGNPLHSIMASSMKYFRQRLADECLLRVTCPSSRNLGMSFETQGGNLVVISDSMREEVEVGSVLASIDGEWVMNKDFKETMSLLTAKDDKVKLQLCTFPRLQSVVDVRFQAQKGQESAFLKGAVAVLSNGNMKIGCNPMQLQSRVNVTSGILGHLEVFQERSKDQSSDGFQSTTSGPVFFNFDLGQSRVHLDADHNLLHIFSSSTSKSLASGVHNSKKLLCTLGPFPASADVHAAVVIEWAVALHASILFATGGDFCVMNELPKDEIFSSDESSTEDSDSGVESDGSLDGREDGENLFRGLPTPHVLIQEHWLLHISLRLLAVFSLRILTIRPLFFACVIINLLCRLRRHSQDRSRWCGSPLFPIGWKGSLRLAQPANISCCAVSNCAAQKPQRGSRNCFGHNCVRKIPPLLPRAARGVACAAGHVHVVADRYHCCVFPLFIGSWPPTYGCSPQPNCSAKDDDSKIPHETDC
jgi:hypothetical protein